MVRVVFTFGFNECEEVVDISLEFFARLESVDVSHKVCFSVVLKAEDDNQDEGSPKDDHC
jgi:hypothetical protein